jgi:hypothetical protein
MMDENRLASGKLRSGQLSDGEVEISGNSFDSQNKKFFALGRLENPTLYDRVASLYSSLFCWLGPLSKLFDHYEVPKSVKRVEHWEKIFQKKTGMHQQDMELALKIRGPFNLKNIVDMMSFRWTR